MNKKEIAQKVAFANYGKPYIWGGDDTVDGFDCSGFCIEILKSVGILPRSGDWTAQMLWDKFIDREVEKPYNGCLVFWHNGTKIVHVEYAITDDLCIGASGGGSRTSSEEDAADQNAYIKIRPWESRSNVKGFVDPFKSIGE